MLPGKHYAEILRCAGSMVHCVMVTLSGSQREGNMPEMDQGIKRLLQAHARR